VSFQLYEGVQPDQENRNMELEARYAITSPIDW